MENKGDIVIYKTSDKETHIEEKSVFMGLVLVSYTWINSNIQK